MQAQGKLGSDADSHDPNFLMGDRVDHLAKLTPILFGMVVGMLIMLLVVYFFPKEYRQPEIQASVPTADNVAANDPSSSQTISTTNVAPSVNSLESSGYTVQVESTTKSGYPVCVSGPSKAVDYFGPGQSGNVYYDPGSSYTVPVAPQVSTTPCVDPPSARGPNVRVVER
jgi:hypothetical protein